MATQDFIDYRGDCWKGIRDVRARLEQDTESLSFKVICDADMVNHICRVVTWAGGVVAGREERRQGTILYIHKEVDL